MVSVQNSVQTEFRTETVVSTVTVEPNSVTVALVNPEQISNSLASAMSVESQQIEINSQLAPINPLTSTRPHVAPTPKTFTRSVGVPVAPAAKSTASNGKPLSSDVYFLAQSNGTTQMLSDIIPNSTLALYTTTITISPIDRATVSASPLHFVTRVTKTQTAAKTETVLRAQGTGNPNTGVYPGVGYGWKNSSTVANGETGTSAGSYPTAAYSALNTTAVNETSAVDATSANATAVSFFHCHELC